MSAVHGRKTKGPQGNARLFPNCVCACVCNTFKYEHDDYLIEFGMSAVPTVDIHWL